MVRGKLIKREGSVCTFECPNGHKSRRDYAKGPVHQRIPDGPGLTFMARMWARDGISYECRNCLGMP